MARPSYAESIEILKERVWIMGDALAAVTRRPRHDDEEPIGPSVFRMLVEDVSLAGLTLHGLYVARTELRRIDFRAADLRLSVFNWSDIIDCDFSETELVDADLRACRFVGCSFRDATFARADLRGAIFEACSFEGATFDAAQLYRRPKLFGIIPTGADQWSLPLSAEQRKAAQWCPEVQWPGGG